MSISIFVVSVERIRMIGRIVEDVHRGMKSVVGIRMRVMTDIRLSDAIVEELLRQK